MCLILIEIFWNRQHPFFFSHFGNTNNYLINFLKKKNWYKKKLNFKFEIFCCSFFFSFSSLFSFSLTLSPPPSPSLSEIFPLLLYPLLPLHHYRRSFSLSLPLPLSPPPSQEDLFPSLFLSWSSSPPHHCQRFVKLKLSFPSFHLIVSIVFIWKIWRFF